MMILVTECIQPVVKFMLCRAEDMSELATVEGSAPDRTNLGRTLKIVGTMVTEALEKASLDSNTKVDAYQYETVFKKKELSHPFPTKYSILFLS